MTIQELADEMNRFVEAMGWYAVELADVALYLLQLAYLAGIDLEQAILDKLAINYSRDWSEE
jgi:NTP pyrophosphatase (non-canonical NTP hydrolase)